MEDSLYYDVGMRPVMYHFALDLWQGSIAAGDSRGTLLKPLIALVLYR
jgi:hypothetical protein